MRSWAAGALGLALVGLGGGGTRQARAQAELKGELRILFADAEGGQATLFVTPGGESLLVDTGWPGSGGRDADRIMELCRRAGLTRIDSVLLTHYHVDHAGGLPELARRIPIGRVIDHGENTETKDKATLGAWEGYQSLLASGRVSRLTVKVGDVLPIKGLRAEVVSSDGQVLQTALKGGGAGGGNAACQGSPEKPVEGSENDRSVGVMISFGKLRVLDLGDLTWGVERGLVCPVNKLGHVDVYVVSHHGTERSGSPALLAAIRPRVAVMDNGAHKGGEPGTFRTLKDPVNGVGALWQLHAAEGVSAELNTEQERMANRAGEDGHWLEVDGAKNGEVMVTNGRTGAVVRYGTK